MTNASSDRSGGQPVRRLGVVLLALGMLAPFLLTQAIAIEPPPELQHVCVDRQDDVHQTVDPSHCSNRERSFDLPQDGPITWCADNQGRLDHSDNGRCGKRDVTLVIPDDGVVYVCAWNIQGNATQPRGAIRWVPDLSHCDPHDETGFATPAAPTAVDDAYEVSEDDVLTVPARGVLDNDLDLTGEPLTAQLVDDVPTGTLALATDGGFTWDGTGNFDDLDEGESTTISFSYFAHDGALGSQVATATITIVGTNDVPVAVADVLTTDEDTLLEVAPPGVLGNDKDAEGHPLLAELVTPPAAGTLALAADGSLVFDPRGAFDHLDEDGAPDDDTTVTFTYVARDTVSSSLETTVQIHVDGVNDPPVGGPDAYATTENVVLRIEPSELLANDVDIDDVGELTLTIVPRSAAHEVGAVRMEAGRVVYDPLTAFDHLATGEVRTDSFAYRVSDGQSTVDVPVEVTVSGRSVPVARPDEVTTDEDSILVVDLTTNDVLDGATFVLLPGAVEGNLVDLGGGRVSFDPRAAFTDLAAGTNRSTTFHYELVNDEGSSGLAQVTVEVTGRNDAPTAMDDPYPVPGGQVFHTGPDDGVLDNDRDLDTDAILTAVLVSPPMLGRLDFQSDGTFTYDPAGEAQEQVVTFTYRASDGTAESATATVELNVGTNAVPVIANDGATWVAFVGDAPGTSVGQVDAVDPESGVLTFEFTSPPPVPLTLGATGDVTVAGTLAAGTHTIGVKVTDPQGGSAVGSFTLEVGQTGGIGGTFATVGNTELVVASTPGPTGDFAVLSTATLEPAAVAEGGTVAARNAGAACSGACPTLRGGTVLVADDGSFTYLPPQPPVTVGGPWDGTGDLVDGFEYQVTRTVGGRTQVDVAEVDITVSETVWYVDGDAATPSGDGTSVAPFTDLDAVTGAAGPDGVGHTIFLSGGTSSCDSPVTAPGCYASGVALLDAQQLVGQPAGLTIAGIQIAAPAPTLSAVVHATAGDAVVLATDNTVRGMHAEGDRGIVGTAPGKAIVSMFTATGRTGPGLSLSDVGSTPPKVDVSIELVESLAAGTALLLDGLDGQVDIGEVMGSQPPAGDPGVAQVVDNAAKVFLALLSTKPGAGDVVVVDGNTNEVNIGQWSGSAGRGLVVTDNRNTVTATSLDVQNSVVGVHVDANQRLVSIGTLTSSGAATVLSQSGGTAGSTVEVNLLQATAPIDNAIAVTGGAGRLHVVDGHAEADPSSFNGSLLFVNGSNGKVEVGADLRLTPPDNVAPLSTARSVHLTDPGPASIAIVSGAITDGGAGVLLDGPADPAAKVGKVRFSGGLDLDTTGSSALVADGIAALEITGVNNTISSAGSSAVALSRTGIGSAGISLGTVTATSPGPGISLDGVQATDTGRLTTFAGDLRGSASNGVLVTDSGGISLIDLVVTRPGAHGVLVEDSRDVVLDGVTVDRADLDGIHVVRSGDVVVTGAEVGNVGRRGIAVHELEGDVELVGSVIRDSRGIQVLVADADGDDEAGTSTNDVLRIDGLIVIGTAPEVESLRIRAEATWVDTDADGAPDEVTDQAALRVVAPATQGSFLGGGRNAVLATADDGAVLELSLALTQILDTDGDAIAMYANGQDTESSPNPSSLTFDLTQLDRNTGGGILSPGGHGILAVGDGTASIGGTVAGATISAPTAAGIHLRGTTDVDVSIVDIEAPRGNAVEVIASTNVFLEQVDATDVFGNGMLAWDVEALTVDDSRFDLRLTPGVERPEGSPGVAGIAARHLSGASAITETTVRGATTHGVIAVNGGLLSKVTEISGIPKPSPRSAVDRPSTMLAGLTVIDSAPQTDAVVAGAGSAGQMDVKLTSATTGVVDQRIRIAAEGGGDVGLSGSHAFRHLGAVAPSPLPPPPGPGEPEPPLRGDAVLATAIGAGSKVIMDDAGLQVTFVPASAEREVARGIVLEGVDGGLLEGTLEDAGVVGADEAGVWIRNVGDLTLTNLDVTGTDGGHGVDAAESKSLGLTRVTILDSKGSGMQARLTGPVTIEGLVVADAGDHGIDIADTSVADDPMSPDHPITASGLRAARTGMDGITITEAASVVLGLAVDGTTPAVDDNGDRGIAVQGVGALTVQADPTTSAPPVAARVSDAGNVGLWVEDAADVDLHDVHVLQSTGNGVEVVQAGHVTATGVLVKQADDHAALFWDLASLQVNESSFTLTGGGSASTFVARHVAGANHVLGTTVEGSDVHQLIFVNGDGIGVLGGEATRTPAPGESVGTLPPPLEQPDTLILEVAGLHSAATPTGFYAALVGGVDTKFSLGDATARDSSIDAPIVVDTDGNGLELTGGHAIVGRAAVDLFLADIGDQWMHVDLRQLELSYLDSVAVPGMAMTLVASHFTGAAEPVDPADPVAGDRHLLRIVDASFGGEGLLIEGDDLGPGATTGVALRTVAGNVTVRDLTAIAGPHALPVGFEITGPGDPDPDPSDPDPDPSMWPCLLLVDNDGTAADVGFELDFVRLRDRAPGQTVAGWVASNGNNGTVDTGANHDAC